MTDDKPHDPLAPRVVTVVTEAHVQAALDDVLDNVGVHSQAAMALEALLKAVRG